MEPAGERQASLRQDENGGLHLVFVFRLGGLVIWTFKLPQLEGTTMPDVNLSSPVDHLYATTYSESEGPGTGSPRLYRAGKPNPANLKPRAVDQGKLSFRDSLSNPWPIEAGQRPVFQPGDSYFAIDPSRLPAGSVIPDSHPQGHVSVADVPPDVIRDAVIERGKLPD